MSTVKGTEEAILNNTEAGDANVKNETTCNSVTIVAPTLRVEELRDDETGHSISNTASGLSEEEGGGSHGEFSDQDMKPEFKEPPDELIQKIIKQVEFYFSDANILKDAFLLKHVRRNKAGYVSLKLITSFKKVKSLTKDYRVVAFSLRRSDQLLVNEDGTKVSRKLPLPEYDETTPSRTVVAVNLPLENPTIENVAELFSGCGDIALVRILRPGKPLPPDLKVHSNRHPELGLSVCAVVEFETHDAAKKASDTLHNSANWRSGMRVMILKALPKREKKKKNKKDRKGEGDSSAHSDAALTGGSDAEQNENRKSRRKSSRVAELSQKRNGEAPCSSGSEAEYADSSERNRARANSAGNLPRKSLSPNPTNKNHLSPNASPKTSPRSSPRNSPGARRKSHGRSPLAAGLSPSQSPKPSPRTSPEARRRTNSSARKGSDGNLEKPSSPWVQRRRLQAQENATANKSNLAATTTSHSPRHSPLMCRRLADGSLPHGSPVPRMANMIGVIRQPTGPDGTRGFHLAKKSADTDNTCDKSYTIP